MALRSRIALGLGVLMLANACQLIAGYEPFKEGTGGAAATRDAGGSMSDAAGPDAAARSAPPRDAGTQATPASEWGCLDSPRSRPEPNESIAVTFRATFVDGSLPLPLPDLRAELCTSSDVACTHPRVATSDDGGAVTFDVYQGFTGALAVSPPPESGLLPLRYEIPPLDRDLEPAGLSVVAPLFRPDQGLVSPWLPELGNGAVIARLRDCAGKYAWGAKLSIDKTAPPMFSVSVLDHTNAPVYEGYEGYVNVPAGSATLTVRLESGRIITRRITVVAGAITFTTIAPP